MTANLLCWCFDMVQVWSCGGGTQSAAIAALIIQGRLPKPDYAVMADTEREKKSTWEFVREVLLPELSRVGVHLEVVPKSRYTSVDLYDGKGTPLMPVFSTRSGSVGQTAAFCSDKWKVRVNERHLRSLGVNTSQTLTWLGFSTDELRRVRAGRFRYPLIFDVPMNRANCKTLVREVFGVEPPRSSCWMCPHMSDREWVDLRDNWPDDFSRACALDAEIRLRDPQVFLHRSASPLIQIADQIGKTEQMDLLGCDSGYCFL